jgi:uncharacterized protein (DUF1499 family)
MTKAATGLAGAGVAYGAWRLWGDRLDGVWNRVFGPPDLGPVDFGNLRRPKAPNNALAAPPSVCAHARADIIPPDFPVSAARLRSIVAEVAADEPNTELVHADPKDEQDRYLVRTRFLRFPDTVDVKVIDRGEGRSTLALYSRSQIGRADFGVNRKRVQRWLDRIGARAAEDSAGGR